MLIVRWNEDKEGCILANWFDEERAEHGGFVESVATMEDELFGRHFRRAMVAVEEAGSSDWDADWEQEAPELAHFALAGGR